MTCCTSKRASYSSRSVDGSGGDAFSRGRYSAIGGDAGGCASSRSIASASRRSVLDDVEAPDALDAAECPQALDDENDDAMLSAPRGIRFQLTARIVGCCLHPSVSKNIVGHVENDLTFSETQHGFSL